MPRPTGSVTAEASGPQVAAYELGAARQTGAKAASVS